MATSQIVLASIIVLLSIIMPIYYSSKNKKKQQEEELKKIKAYGESLNNLTRSKNKQSTY